LVVFERVGVESHAVTEFVNALCVVVLVPEQRQHDHRLAEVERLGSRVVPAVSDDQVGVGQHVRLGHLRSTPHVRGKFVLVGERTFGDDEPMASRAKHGDQPSHQFDIGRAQRAEREVDQLAGRVGCW